MKILVALLMSTLVFTASAMAQTSLSVKPRAVVELFTSQGCSSCPPADKLFSELSKDPSLIVLTMPVDYWDYLGWKDTLASPAFTSRQKGYSAMRGDRQVYTPQAVINGVSHAIGSQRSEIDKAISNSSQKDNILSVDVTINKTNGDFKASVAAAQGLSGEIWVLPVLKERAVQIGRGENSGRSVTYSNVVRGMVRVGTWNGNAMTVDVPASALPAECEGFVVLLQAGSDKKPAQIIGAARQSI